MYNKITVIKYYCTIIKDQETILKQKSESNGTDLHIHGLDIKTTEI